MQKKMVYALLVAASVVTTITTPFNLPVAGTPQAGAISPTCPTTLSSQSQWNRTYGGTALEVASSVEETLDGGYIIAGFTESFGAGLGDMWLVKTDPTGNQEWNKTYGGAKVDDATSVLQTSDGGYIVGGYTESFGAGLGDMWLVKVNSSGDPQWNRTYGGTDYDNAWCTRRTSDGGYIMVGQTASFGAGSTDMWLVKVNSSGDPQWNRTYGGPGLESPISVQQTIDGGYVIAGYMAALDASSGDMWLVKTDSMGNQEWNKTYGGTSNDAAKSVQQTLDGGYVLAGYTDSFGAGSADIWVVKVDSLGEPQWKKTFGGSGDDAANSILQTSDGAYVVAGMYGQYNEPFITQPSDLWLVNVSSSGEMQGSETYGGSLNDYASCVQQTSDGGFIVLGSTGSFGAGDSDFWLLKIAQVTGEFGTDITTTTAPIIPLIFLTGGAAIAAVDAVLIAFIVMKRKQYRAIDSVREP